MEISTRVEGETAILKLEGSLIAGEAERAFSEEAEGLVRDGVRTIVVDLAGISFVDSSGLGSLIHCYKECTQAGGGMRLRRVSDQLRGLLEIARLTDLMPIEEENG